MLGHMLGPFDEPPLEGMVYSPINLVPKARSKNKYRLIHDLAYPYNTNQSMNSCIPEENSKVEYHQIDEVIQMALSLGILVKGARCDIKAAFRNQGVIEWEIRLLAFTFEGQIYINCSIPFGASSSCAIFEKVTGVLQ